MGIGPTGGVPQAEGIYQRREAIPPHSGCYWDGGAGMLRCGHLVQPNIFNKVEITRTHQVTLPLQVHTHAIVDECLLVGAAVGQVGGDK